MTLVCGLTITAAFATVVVGQLNLISLAFSALYIGLAIDFSAHWLVHFNESHSLHGDLKLAASDSSHATAGALLTCALTTAFAFYAFTPTAYQGVAELGLIGGSGILIGLIVSLTLLPALVRLLPPAARLPAAHHHGQHSILNLPWQYRRLFQALGLVLAALGLLAIPQLRFDLNPMHLKPPLSPSMQGYQSLLDQGEHLVYALLIADGPLQARALAERLDQLPEVSQVISADRLIPEQQQNKLALIEDLALSAGLSLPAEIELSRSDLPETIAAMRETAAAAIALTPDHPLAIPAAQLAQSINTALASDRFVTALHEPLLRHLPGLFPRIQTLLSASEVSLETLPEPLARRWIDPDGHWRLLIKPSRSLDLDADLRAFVAAIKQISPEVTGPAPDYISGAASVIGAFNQAFASAIGIILVVLLVTFRNLGDCLRALAPLLLGGLCTGALAAVLDWPINFANIIALPLLFGVAVDTGIHIIWRHRQGQSSNPVTGVTGKAIALSIGTTMGSFIALGFSPHPGMASMGRLLALGLALMLVCSMLILPALLPRRVKTPASAHSI